MLKAKFVYVSTVVALLAALLVPAFGGAIVLAASVFYDFQSGNANGWTPYGGTWTVVNGEYTVNAGAGNKSVITGSNYNSFIYEADVNVAAGGNAGFIIRAGSLGVGADAYTGYYIGLNTAGNTVQQGKVNNNWTMMIDYPYTVTANTWYHLKVIAAGGSMDTYVNNVHVLSTFDKTFPSGAVGLRVFNTSAKFDNVRVTDNGVINSPTYNWSGKKGAIYVPTNAVNMIDFWQTYDSGIVDRELGYGQTYGMNSIAVYLPYKMWVNNPTNLLNNFENFLTIANNHGMKVSPIFFDNCWNGTVNLGAQGAPIPGVHNSRWVQSPGDDIKTNYFASYKTSIRNYVQAFVNAHLSDSRIMFWEQMNEPGCSGFRNDITIVLMNDARIAIKETGSTIPVNSCACQLYEGAYFSDFFSYHDYNAAYDAGPKGSQYFMTEGMNRGSQTIPGMAAAYGSGTGWMVWEMMIGRSNTRFPWGSPQGAPEPATPFHGVIYPDGHPWAVNDIVAFGGPTINMPVYTVNYYNGIAFNTLKKTSVTPLIYFDLNTEPGTASPDASAGVSETNYSIRWTGTIRPAATGTFTFYADSDNKARIWVNGVQVVNKTTTTRSEVSGTAALTANTNYPVTIEYEHTTGASVMHVQWAGPSLSKQPMRVQPGGGGGNPTATPNPNPQPVALYAFENNANDTSGNGNNGTATAVTYVAGHLGQAANFNGTTAYVQIPRSIQDNFTIAFWVKTSATGGAGTQWYNGQGLVDGEVAGVANDFGVSLVGAQAAFGVGNADATIKSTSNINNNAWHRVAVTRDSVSGQIKVYFDGALQTTGTGPTGTKNAPANLRIGSLLTNLNFFSGQIDEVRLYNSVLTATQVSAIP